MLSALPFVCPRAVSADALAPPPTNCPDGSVGVSSRRGEHCEHAPCEGACSGGMDGRSVVCSADAVAVCVETRTFPAADVQQGPRSVSLPAETWNVVHGPCGSGGSCAVGQCVRRRACVPEGSSHSSSCSVGAVRTGSVLGLGLVGLVIAVPLAVRTKRTRPRP